MLGTCRSKATPLMQLASCIHKLHTLQPNIWVVAVVQRPMCVMCVCACCKGLKGWIQTTCACDCVLLLLPLLW